MESIPPALAVTWGNYNIFQILKLFMSKFLQIYNSNSHINRNKNITFVSYQHFSPQMIKLHPEFRNLDLIIHIFAYIKKTIPN